MGYVGHSVGIINTILYGNNPLLSMHVNTLQPVCFGFSHARVWIKLVHGRFPVAAARCCSGLVSFVMTREAFLLHLKAGGVAGQPAERDLRSIQGNVVFQRFNEDCEVAVAQIRRWGLLSLFLGLADSHW